MSIIRVVKNNNYFVASNEPFNDKHLSWEARGVMGYLLSKPDNWQVMFNDLVNSGPAGEKFIRRILKELQEYGYLERKQSHLPNGKYEWVSTVYETPHMGVETMLPPGVDGSTISPLRTSPSSTSPEGLHIISTESTNTESISTEIKERRRGKNTPDGRLKHPAIVVYRDVAKLTPAEALRDDIIKSIGDDYIRWGNIVKQWIGNGWNPGNINGMLEYYANGGKQNGLKGYTHA